MTPKKKRPKVRYVAGEFGTDGVVRQYVCNTKRNPLVNRICDCYTKGEARRIAAALNVYEARRRGELT